MNENEYCLVSKELLVFLKWICENEPEIITKIVSKAWKKGFKEVLENVKSDELNQTDLQESVFDFFSIMETCIEKFKKNSTKKILNLISEKIDPTVIASLNLNEEETEAYKLLLARRKKAIFCFLKNLGLITLDITKATHNALSFSETKNNPLLPLVPVESPTVISLISLSNALLCSASMAKGIALLKLNPQVFMVSKFSINNCLDIKGKLFH